MEARNFRSYYYEKVGFRVVEEKKSLEILLKEKPVDKMKLTHFALRFPVPNMYRTTLYCIVMDILPTYIDQHKFVGEQRKQQFEDLMHYLRLIQVNNHQIPKPQLYTYMRALETGNLKLNYLQQLKDRDNQIFTRVCEALGDIVEAESDVYWIAKNFFEILKSFRPYLPALVSYSDKVLKRENYDLYNYLVRQHIWEALPLEQWYESGFATFLPGYALQRVWDKFLGGSSMVMVFVMVALLLKIRQAVLTMNTVQKVLDFARSLTESCFEMVVTDGITLWQQYGSPLHPGSNTDCLKDHSKVAHKTSNKNSNHHSHPTTMPR